MAIKYNLIFGFYFTGHFLLAQAGLVTAGGQAVSGSGTISYSIGQIDYTQVKAQNGSLSMGLQQPFEIYEIVGTKEETFATPVTVYPNPTDGFICIEMSEPNVEGTKYLITVTDIQGKIIKQQNISGKENKIDLVQCNAGLYILSVKNSSNQYRNFKIIKK